MDRVENQIDGQTLDLLSRIALNGKLLVYSAYPFEVKRDNKLMRQTGLVNIRRTREYGDSKYEYTPLGKLKELTEEVERIRGQASRELLQHIEQRLTGIMRTPTSVLSDSPTEQPTSFEGGQDHVSTGN